MKWLITYILIILSFTLNAETIYSDLIGGSTNNSGGVWDETDIAIDVSLHTAITIDINYGETGDLEKFDKFEIHYRLDFGAWVKPVKIKNDMAGDATLSITALEGSDLEIKIRMMNDDNGETWFWDDLVVTGTPIPLPVELVSFTAETYTHHLMIKWKTASEINNDYFQLEQSTDGVNYESFRFVAGAGNSTTPITYSIETELPTTTTYYRLKQVDFNSTYEYSNIIHISPQLEIKTIIGEFDLNGRPVSGNYKGFTIIKYSDGTYDKIIR